MAQRDFYVDKTTQTFADSLAAFGLGRLLHELLERAAPGRSRLQLEDGGSCYCLTAEPAVEDAWLDGACRVPFILAPVIRTIKNRDGLPAGLSAGAIVDYEAKKEETARYWTAYRALPKEARPRIDENGFPPLAEAPEPDERWDIFRALNPAGLIGYNALLCQWWAAQPALPDVLRVLFALTSGTPNNIEAAETAWKQLAKVRNLAGACDATAGQLYNPAQGKGQNRAKADALAMGNLKGFWLLEFLKAVGFYQAGFTRLLKGSKDRKSYVLAPRRLDWAHQAAIMARFRNRMIFAESATRSDILVALRYTLAFLDYAVEPTAEAPRSGWAALARPRDAVAGFNSAFYKNLGNSAATMNLSFINLPGWVRVGSGADAVAYREVLREHEQVVRSLDESHSDAYDLLLRYRDFIAGDDLAAFFDFTTGYSGYLIGQRERGKFAPQFSEENLGRLLMSASDDDHVKLAPILDPKLHPGFDRIAYAIRQSTVTAQFRKQQNDRRYDVRYGLGQDLARKANYADEFVAALCEFLQKYNQENAQVMERRSGPYRRSVETSDIQDVLSLIDTYGSKLICNLLIAYGYARSGKSKDDDRADDAEPELPAADDADNDAEV